MDDFTWMDRIAIAGSHSGIPIRFPGRHRNGFDGDQSPAAETCLRCAFSFVGATNIDVSSEQRQLSTAKPQQCIEQTIASLQVSLRA
jgi:hypothetical protein